MIRRFLPLALTAGLAVTVACGSDSDFAFGSSGAGTATSVPSTSGPGTEASAEPDVVVTVDAARAGEPISPLITGLSSSLSADELTAAGVTLNSWGGNPSSRYNYTIGHAWNHGADWEFRNTNYGASGDSMRAFLDVSRSAGIASRVAVPALGWVASDDDNATCSFPDGSGGCLPAPAVGNCQSPVETTEPDVANVASTPNGVAAWIEGLVADGYQLDVLAVDNEPELWGFTHYDVHPTCTTPDEVLSTYLTYAEALRAVAPDSLLAGPVICCWFDYWGDAPKPGPSEDFVHWFLSSVKAHDDETGQRSIDLLDVHYYPQGTGVYNGDVDAQTAALRLRSTRSLWDPGYADESWIGQPIELVPRMLRTIDEAYPGVRLLISEWNFGADETMNGALAIADALGIFGREGVYAAAYWRNPPVGSPGYLAFQMHGNYDGDGGRFGGRTIPVVSPDVDRLSVYAALGEDGTLRVMMINKDAETDVTVSLALAGFEPAATARRFTLADGADRIVPTTAASGATLTVGRSSVTVVELEPA